MGYITSFDVFCREGFRVRVSYSRPGEVGGVQSPWLVLELQRYRPSLLIRSRGRDVDTVSLFRLLRLSKLSLTGAVQHSSCCECQCSLKKYPPASLWLTDLCSPSPPSTSPNIQRCCDLHTTTSKISSCS